MWIIIIIAILYLVLQIKLQISLDYRRQCQDDFFAFKILVFIRLPLLDLTLPTIRSKQSKGLFQLLSKINVK